MANRCRSKCGITIGDILITPRIIIHHLRRNPDLGEQKIQDLMNPSDPQDVPRAIELIRAISATSSLPLESCNPTEHHEAGMISLIGEAFSAFMEPFIQPSWSLTEQVISLSKYAHMSCHLFRQHRAAFIPAQLYTDTQTAVKNVMFCIAKQQELDGNQRFHIFWTGDDKLEAFFGIIRMIGGHNPNFTFKQLMDRICAALDVGFVFAKNPQLDRGSRRRNLTRSEVADHVNAEMVTGEIAANSVDLECAWDEGGNSATVALRSKNQLVDFKSLFGTDRTLDMLKPFGDGKIPGVGTACARTDVLDNTECQDLPCANLLEAEPEDPAANDPEAALHGGCSHEQMIVQEGLTTNGATTREALEDEGEDSLNLEDTLELDRLVNESFPAEYDIDEDSNQFGSECASMSHSGSSSHMWIQHEGRSIHKATICRIVITPTYSRKSHERLLRVRGYGANSKPRIDCLPNPDSTIDGDNENSLTKDLFMDGDLFAALVQCDGRVCLAIVKCVQMEMKGTRVGSIHAQSFTSEGDHLRLSGQILSLRHFNSTSAPSSSIAESRQHSPDHNGQPAMHAQLDEHSLTSMQLSANSSHSQAVVVASVSLHDTDGENDSDSGVWVWSGSCVNVHDGSSANRSNGGGLITGFVGNICKPLNPLIQKLDSSFCDNLPALNKDGISWVFSQAELTFVILSLWEGFKGSPGSSSSLKAIPTVCKSEEFPYCNNTGINSMCTRKWLLT